MGSLGRLWRGELTLADAFWNWAVFGGLMVNIISTLGFFILLAARMPIAAFIIGHGFSVPYNILVVVGVWRSAARHEGSRSHAQAARIVALVGMVLLTLA